MNLDIYLKYDDCLNMFWVTSFEAPLFWSFL